MPCAQSPTSAWAHTLRLHVELQGETPPSVEGLEVGGTLPHAAAEVAALPPQLRVPLLSRHLSRTRTQTASHLHSTPPLPLPSALLDYQLRWIENAGGFSVYGPCWWHLHRWWTCSWACFDVGCCDHDEHPAVLQHFVIPLRPHTSTTVSPAVHNTPTRATCAPASAMESLPHERLLLTDIVRSTHTAESASELMQSSRIFQVCRNRH